MFHVLYLVATREGNVFQMWGVGGRPHSFPSQEEAWAAARGAFGEYPHTLNPNVWNLCVCHEDDLPDYGIETEEGGYVRIPDLSPREGPVQ
jgi:hypothetical protein